MNRFDVVGSARSTDELFRVNRIAGEEESFIESHDETCSSLQSK
jgi:hypothetical protein